MADVTVRSAFFDTVGQKLLPLAINAKANRGCIACGDTSSGTVKQAASGNANLVPLGLFDADYDNTAGAGTVLVNIEFFHELICYWFDSVTGAGAVTSSNLFADVYMSDNHTVTTTSSGNSKIGRVLGTDTLKGILVQPYSLGA